MGVAVGGKALAQACVGSDWTLEVVVGTDLCGRLTMLSHFDG